KCGNHGNKHFSQHEKPAECKNCMVQAKLLLCSVNSLAEMEAIYPEAVVITTGATSHWGVDCKFVADEEISIDITEKNNSRFIIEESCNVFGCSVKRELYKYPDVATIAMLEMIEDGKSVPNVQADKKKTGAVL